MPLGKLEIVRVRAVEVIVILNTPVPLVPAASNAWIVKVDTPAVVGVPASTPPADSVRPAGKDPESTLNVYGAMPPLATKVVEYALPTVPAGGLPEMVSGGAIGAATTIVSGAFTT